MGTKRERNMSIIFISCLISLFIGCFFTSSAVFAQTIKTLKVGSILPLNFGMGVDTKNMLELLASQLNAQGGITVKGQKYSIELMIYDDKFTAEAGRAAMERLFYQDNAKFLISTIASPTIVSGLSLVEREKVLHLTTGTTLKMINPKLRYTFSTNITLTSTAPLWFMVKRLHPSARTAVFMSPDNEGGRSRASDEKRVAEVFGVKVLDILYYPRDAVDFTAISARAKSYNPDLVDYPGAASGTQFGLQLKGMHAAGFRGAQVSAIGPKMDEVRAVASNDALEGVVTRVADTELPEPPPIAKALKNDYANKFGKWSDAGLSWSTAWQVLIAAIKKTGSVDPTTIADYIAKNGLEFQRPDGTKCRMVRRPDLNNSKYCDTLCESTYGTIKSGAFAPVARVTIDEVIDANEKVSGGTGWR